MPNNSLTIDVHLSCSYYGCKLRRNYMCESIQYSIQWSPRITTGICSTKSIVITRHDELRDSFNGEFSFRATQSLIVKTRLIILRIETGNCTDFTALSIISQMSNFCSIKKWTSTMNDDLLLDMIIQNNNKSGWLDRAAGSLDGAFCLTKWTGNGAKYVITILCTLTLIRRKRPFCPLIQKVKIFQIPFFFEHLNNWL